MQNYLIFSSIITLVFRRNLLCNLLDFFSEVLRSDYSDFTSMRKQLLFQIVCRRHIILELGKSVTFINYILRMMQRKSFEIFSLGSIHLQLYGLCRICLIHYYTKTVIKFPQRLSFRLCK